MQWISRNSHKGCFAISPNNVHVVFESSWNKLCVVDFEHGNIVCNFSVPANSFLSKIDQILWVDDERLLVACFSTLFLYDINLIQTNSIEIQNLHFARMSLQPDKTVWLSSSSPKTLLKINNDNTLDAPNMGRLAKQDMWALLRSTPFLSTCHDNPSQRTACSIILGR